MCCAWVGKLDLVGNKVCEKISAFVGTWEGQELVRYVLDLIPVYVIPSHVENRSAVWWFQGPICAQPHTHQGKLFLSGLQERGYHVDQMLFQLNLVDLEVVTDLYTACRSLFYLAVFTSDPRLITGYPHLISMTCGSWGWAGRSLSPRSADTHMSKAPLVENPTRSLITWSWLFLFAWPSTMPALLHETH